MDCHTRQLLGWHLSRSGKVTTTASALEQALIYRYGSLEHVREPFLLRADNGLRQGFSTLHCPQQDGMVERLIRTLKEQCVHRHRFEGLQHAMRVIGDWIQFYTTGARTKRWE